MTESKTTVPHFYVQADVYLDPLLGLLERLNRRYPTYVRLWKVTLPVGCLVIR